jgi:predicted ATP-dependent protease
VLAAHRAGVKTVVIPDDNERDLDDVPEDVRKDLAVALADHVDDVLNAALHPEQRDEPVKLAPALKDGGRATRNGRRTTGARRNSGAPRAAQGT